MRLLQSMIVLITTGPKELTDVLLLEVSVLCHSSTGMIDQKCKKESVSGARIELATFTVP
jgi:hypothetical protein